MANVCRRRHLKELHELSAIAEVFRYDLEGGGISGLFQLCMDVLQNGGVSIPQNRL